eukprot:1159518-Pelagomonas_calceolata.AAC.6
MESALEIRRHNLRQKWAGLACWEYRGVTQVELCAPKLAILSFGHTNSNFKCATLTLGVQAKQNYLSGKL